ncbi:MAG: DNA polymerase Y family protein [Burkholderiaceae bacterium]
MYWLALQPLPELAADAAAASSGLPDTASPDAPVDGPDAVPELADAASALGWWVLRFTPRVLLQAPVVLLEVSTSERLFGGRQQLIARLLAADRPVARVRWAEADTALLALARLQVGASASPQADHLPLHTLADARPHLATLERLGCRLWGDLRALPRGGVVRRFGAPLLDALDRAYGFKPEVYPWLVLPEVFDMPLELQAQVEAAPALLFAARRLLAQLRVWLQARQRGVLAFELCWQMDARRDTATEGSVLIRTATPTLDMVHLQRLLAENLARISLPAPVLYLHLRTLETVAWSGATASLLPDEQRRGDDWVQLLERLAARLGPEQVLQVMPHADHRPECMQAWVPAAGGMPGADAPHSARASAGGAGKKRQGSSGAGSGKGDGSRNDNSGGKRATTRKAPMLRDALYPTWLLATPLRLAVRNDRPLYQGPLTLLAGPQRLEAAWWDVARVPAVAAIAAGAVVAQESRPSGVLPPAVPTTAADPPLLPDASQTSRLALRDYFLARSTQAGLLWIYRERLTAARVGGDPSAGHWYLHGVFG